MRRRAKAILASLQRFPESSDWLAVGGCGLAFVAIAYVVKPDSVDLASAPTVPELVRMAAIAFVVPAFAEELVFRAVLTPAFTWPWALLSTGTYVAWHPLAAYAFMPEALPLFADGMFLALVAALGALCWVAHWRTRSLWSSIVLHWLVVVVWKAASGTSFIA